MKNIISGVVLIFIFNLTNAYGQYDISISDFRYPLTRGQDLKISGSFNFNSESDEYDYYNKNYNEFVSKEGDNNSWWISAGSRYLYFRNSEDNELEIDLSGNILGYFNSINRDGSDYQVEKYSAVTRQWRSFARVNLDYLHYLVKEKLHLFSVINSNLSNFYSSSKIKQKSNEEYRNRYEDNYLYFNSGSVFGVGWGKIRDGIFVFQAVRIIEKINEERVLTRDLTKDEILEIVDVLAKIREYTTNYERYKKYLYRDIISILESKDLFKSGFAPVYLVLKSEETVNELIHRRLFGYRIFYGFKYNLQKNINSGFDEKSDYDYYKTEFLEDVNHLIGFTYGYPISLYMHFYFESELTFPQRNLANRIGINISPSLSWELSDKFDLLTILRLDKNSTEVEHQHYNLIVRHRYNAEVNFIYYVEDKISITSSIGYTYRKEKVYYTDLARTGGFKNSGLFFTISCNYNLL